MLKLHVALLLYLHTFCAARLALECCQMKLKMCFLFDPAITAAGGRTLDPNWLLCAARKISCKSSKRSNS